MSLKSETSKIIQPKHQLKLFGYDYYFKSFIQLFQKNKLPNTILLSGLKGSGKATFAYHFTNYLLSQNELNKYSTQDFTINSENKSYKLLSNNIHPNFFLLETVNYEENIKIDYVRQILRFLNKSTDNSNFKIVLIDNAEYLNVNSSNAFNDSLNLTGVILTKMDGDSRGGAALSIREVTGKPIKFMGTGESMKDFEAFHPDRLAKRILGMGDVVSLVEKAQEAFDEEKAETLQKKLIENKFTLVDFQDQLKQMQNMGSMSEMLKMIPGAGKLGKMKFDDRQLKWIDAIIKSMTPVERITPEIINGSRRKRIAIGSGRTVQEVNQLLKQFHQMQKMMKKIGNKGGMRLPFGIK